MNILLVFAGGAIGAPSRYLLDSYVRRRTGGRFPYGTLLVNVAGCLLLGLLAGAAGSGDLSSGAELLLGTGFCGGLTTFSTFSVEAIELVQHRRGPAAAGYVVASCALGIGAAAVGYALW